MGPGFVNLCLFLKFKIVFGEFSWLELADSRELIRKRLNIESNSLLKPTKVGFIFIGPYFLSGA